MGDMSQKFTHSKDYQNLLSNIVENEISTSGPNNELLWVAMGNELEIEGVPKEQISTIIRKDIEDKIWETQFKEECTRNDYRYRNTKYYGVMKDNGWTNPEMARNTSNNNLDPQTDQNIVPHNNKEMKAVCYDIINLCRIIIEKSKDCESFDDIFSEKVMNEFYLQMHTMINNCKNSIDSKTKVPNNTEVLLLGYLSTVTGNVNKCAELFMRNSLSLLEKQGKFLTTKQASKFQKGMKQSQQFILKPTNRDTAVYAGYTGIQCKCGSFRVRPTQNMNGLECYDCDGTITGAYIAKCTSCYTPLYKKRLLHIIHTGKCQNCNCTVDLPDSLIQYAKS